MQKKNHNAAMLATFILTWSTLESISSFKMKHITKTITVFAIMFFRQRFLESQC